MGRSSEVEDSDKKKKKKKDKKSKDKDVEYTSSDDDDVLASDEENKASSKKKKKQKDKDKKDADVSSDDDDGVNSDNDSSKDKKKKKKKRDKKKKKDKKGKKSGSDLSDGSDDDVDDAEDEDASPPSAPPMAEKPRRSIATSRAPGEKVVVELFEAGEAATPTEGAKLFSDVTDDALKKWCKKLYKLLNLDPWNEASRYDDDDTCDVLIEHPETYQIKFEFEGFSGRIYPLSMLCALQASKDAVELAYDAFPPCDQKVRLVGRNAYALCGTIQGIC